MATKHHYLPTEERSGKAIAEKELQNDAIVRLNSTAVIKDKLTGKELSFTIVLPEQADIKQNKVSMLAPAASALMGLKQGEEASWVTPAGRKHFYIMEVRQSDQA